jgi:hypothetical protein
VTDPNPIVDALLASGRRELANETGVDTTQSEWVSTDACAACGQPLTGVFTFAVLVLESGPATIIATCQACTDLDSVIALCRAEMAKVEADPSTDGLQHLMSIALAAMPTLLGAIEATRARVAGITEDRDRLSAQLERVRAALAGHPRCDVIPDDDLVSCGWKHAVADIQHAIDAPHTAQKETDRG